MANDRLYAECQLCRKAVVFAKYGPSTSPDVDSEGAERLREFLDHHVGSCHAPANDLSSLGSDVPFLLHTEGSYCAETGSATIAPERRWTPPQEDDA